MTKRIPIKAARDLAKEHGLTHVIILARDDTGRDHVVTYGRTVEEGGQVADAGNRLKQVLGWPESLQAQPSRVQRLQVRVAELERKMAERDGGM